MSWTVDDREAISAAFSQRGPDLRWECSEFHALLKKVGGISFEDFWKLDGVGEPGAYIYAEEFLKWVFEPPSNDPFESWRMIRKEYEPKHLGDCARQALGKMKLNAAQQHPEYYNSSDSIKNILETGIMKLLRGQWLVNFAKEGAVLPRCQEIPEAAAWPVEESPWLKALISISYCWCTAAHPDPHGEQLINYLGPLLQLYHDKPPTTMDPTQTAVFMDWVCFPQRDRTEEEQANFGKLLKNVNLWYLHMLIEVWMFTRVPEKVPSGFTQYADRGWPTFEKAVSSMIKEPARVLDVGKLLPGVDHPVYKTEVPWDESFADMATAFEKISAKMGEFEKEILEANGLDRDNLVVSVDHAGETFTMERMMSGAVGSDYSIKLAKLEQCAKLAQLAQSQSQMSQMAQSQMAMMGVAAPSSDEFPLTIKYGLKGAMNNMKYVDALGQGDPTRPCVTNYCQVGRNPPISPMRFAESLATKKFTNGADKAFVVKKYAETFWDVMSSRKSLRFQCLLWEDDALATLCESLKFCDVLEAISLRQNKFKNIPSSLLNSQTLRYLDLKGNGLCSLEPGAFSGLGSLLMLMLDFNKIRHLETGSLNGLRSLQVLSLASTGLRTIGVEAFKDLVNVERICLASNHLRRIDAEAFKGLSKLLLLNFFMNFFGDKAFQEHQPSASEDVVIGLVADPSTPVTMQQTEEFKLGAGVNNSQGMYDLEWEELTYTKDKQLLLHRPMDGQVDPTLYPLQTVYIKRDKLGMDAAQGEFENALARIAPNCHLAELWAPGHLPGMHLDATDLKQPDKEMPTMRKRPEAKDAYLPDGSLDWNQVGTLDLTFCPIALRWDISAGAEARAMAGISMHSNNRAWDISAPPGCPQQ